MNLTRPDDKAAALLARAMLGDSDPGQEGGAGDGDQARDREGGAGAVGVPGVVGHNCQTDRRGYEYSILKF